MLDCDQTTLRELHRAIRYGQLHGLSEGLALEGELARGSLDRFDPARFAATRGAVFRRGRGQAGSAP